MGLQDVDFGLVYNPGKNEAEPLDFLSRNLLPETSQDTVDEIVKQVITEEHAVVVDQILKETQKDI